MNGSQSGGLLWLSHSWSDPHAHPHPLSITHRWGSDADGIRERGGSRPCGRAYGHGRGAGAAQRMNEAGTRARLQNPPLSEPRRSITGNTNLEAFSAPRERRSPRPRPRVYLFRNAAAYRTLWGYRELKALRRTRCALAWL